MDPYDVREANSLRALANSRVEELNEQISKQMHAERASRIRASLTYFVGGLLAFIGTAASFLGGVDWSVLFRPETAALAGASVVFVRALVVFLQRPKT